MIGRLKHEGNHGETLVSRALGYLAASRYGLAEDELVDLLSRDLEVYAWFFRQTYHLPSDLVQRAIEYRRRPAGEEVHREGEPAQDEETATLSWLKKLKRGYLFCAAPGFAGKLDERTISVDLKELFRQYGHPLTAEAEVEVEETWSKWKVVEADSQYSIEREDQTLNVYLEWDRTPPEPVVDLLKEVLPRADGPRLPVVLWSRLSFDLAPYLAERLVDGSSLLAFYHRELGDVSKAAFLAGDQAQDYHGKLADYFRFKADPAGDGSWTGGNVRGLSELPYHLTEAGRHQEVYQTLTDFKFLEHKAEEVGITRRTDQAGREQITSDGVHRLQQDVERALAAGGSGAAGAGLRAPLIITARQTKAGLTITCPVCNKSAPITDKQRGTEIACPQKSCEAPLKLNPFVIDMR